MHAQALKQALIYSIGDKYVALGFRFVSSILLARLLTPESIGIFSVSFVLINFAHGMRDFGVSQYLIRQPTITHEQCETAFTLNFLLSIVLWASLYFGGSIIGELMHSTDVIPVIKSLSWIFLLVPFGSIRLALLKRDMHFKEITVINFWSYLVLHVTCLYLAWLGFGVNALIWGNVLGTLVTVLGAQWYSRKMQTFYLCYRGVSEIIRFGLGVSASQMIESLTQGIPEMVIGKNFGMESAGFFSKGQGCVALFKTVITQGIMPVILPHFSKQARMGVEIGKEYLKWLLYYNLIAWPFFISVSLLAEPIILLLFGSAWRESAQVVRVLCGFGLIEAALPFYQSLLILAEKIKFYFKYQITHAILRMISIAFALPYGMQGICLALVISEAIACLILFHYLSPMFRLTYTAWLKAVLPGIFLSFLVMCMIIRWV